MPSEFDLLRPLDDEPRTPSTVDIRRAIADGRRRRRTRRGAAYAGVAAVTALSLAGVSLAANGRVNHAPPDAAASRGQATTATSAPAATAPTSCALERLPAPDNDPMALVSGADPTGSYLVGRSYPKAGGYQAVIWHNGKVRKVMLPGDIEESLRDVNSTGTAVGWSYDGDRGKENTRQIPYVYRDGKVSKLPGDVQGSAEAINDAGAIVGNDDADGAVLWPSATAQPVRLPKPAGVTQGTASDIDEDGTVVGNFDYVRPYVWFADGTHRDLPMPTLDGKKAVGARVFSIRNGWAIGVADANADARAGINPKTSEPSNPNDAAKRAKSEQMRAVQWNVRTGEVLMADEFNWPHTSRTPCPTFRAR
jgi:uncharacterized membrane protein